MRNGGCVPGHSISAAFHQSRGREGCGVGGAGAPLLVSVSPYAHLREQTTGGAAYRLTHAIAFTHKRLRAQRVGDAHAAAGYTTRTNTHAHTSNMAQARGRNINT